MAKLFYRCESWMGSPAAGAKTRYVATEEEIRKEHAEAELVPGTWEVRHIDEQRLTAGPVQRGPDRRKT